jgi:hypothetical protein
MTRQELECLLGPGEDITGKMMVTHHIGGQHVPVVTGEQTWLWKDGHTEIWVGFTSDRVVSKWFRDLNYL